MIPAVPLLCVCLAAPPAPPGAADIPTLSAEPASGYAAVPTLAAPPAELPAAVSFPPPSGSVPAEAAYIEPGVPVFAEPPPSRRPHERGSKIGPPYHYEAVFQPPPLGDSVHATMDAQVRNGEAALDVLHRSDFLAGQAELSPGGLRHLARIAARLPSHARPVLLEPPARWEPNAAALAAARRARVAELLAGGAFPVPPERVVIVPDPATGLAGADAELVYRNLLILTGSGGKLRTRFDVFGSAAQSPTAAGAAAAPPATGAPR
ncbi:hypothetical protein [Alienimonas sp. DA493]|uniref:hypothetical protein n=1 Tax=Alienimonas sp. DA493 TaxID=3373605 RepID=UPI003754A9CB